MPENASVNNFLSWKGSFVNLDDVF